MSRLDRPDRDRAPSARRFRRVFERQNVFAASERIGVDSQQHKSPETAAAIRSRSASPSQESPPRGARTNEARSAAAGTAAGGVNRRVGRVAKAGDAGPRPGTGASDFRSVGDRAEPSGWNLGRTTGQRRPASGEPGRRIGARDGARIARFRDAADAAIYTPAAVPGCR